MCVYGGVAWASVNGVVSLGGRAVGVACASVNVVIRAGRFGKKLNLYFFVTFDRFLIFI